MYNQIISILDTYGTVLTEHVGDAQVLEKETGVSHQKIFCQDVEWLTHADVIVAEVTQPSLGVGYGIGIAQKIGKKILCLYRPKPDKTLSSMIAGNPDIVIKEYQSIEELKTILKDFFEQ